MKIGVIGLGVVGEVVCKTQMKYHDVAGYDKFKKMGHLEDVYDCDVIFLAVPTPEGSDGRLDCSIVTEVIQDLEKAQVKGIVAVKSSLRVGYLKDLKTSLRIVYNPEFLHDRTRWEDYENAPFVVLAGSSADIQIMKKVYCWVPSNKFEIMTYEEAVMIKLLMNAFASTKISFWNETRRLCETLNIDVTRMRDVLKKDTKRWTDEYTDPKQGAYGGACLPKDIRELINWGKEKAILLKAVEEVNEDVKRERLNL
jgi:UDPglucose 6-dehydrogenase